jgi:chemotaxis protein methyltransferase CheR
MTDGMSDSDFAFLQGFVLKGAGADLWKEKRYFADVRLSALARSLGRAGAAQLLAEIRHAPSGETALRVLEGMTTNETLFFRDAAPFQHLESVLLPMLAREYPARRTLRIWCAAVASGQEAYSVAMMCVRHRALLGSIRVEIIGTDLSRAMIERAQAGSYSHFEVQRGLPIQIMLEHFKPDGDAWQISTALRNMVDFRVMNLLDDAPGLGRFDVILLRNVLVYLEAGIKREVLARVASHLAPGGLMLLGAAESALGLGNAVVPHQEHRGFYGLPGAPEKDVGTAVAAPVARRHAVV